MDVEEAPPTADGGGMQSSGERVGCAEAGRYFSHNPEAAAKHEGDYRAYKDVVFHGDEIVYCSAGDGTTSEGEFWEAMNTACNQKLPVLFMIEDNEYAISVPVEVQTAGGSVSKLVRNFPNLLVEECDGTDPVASYVTLKRAAEYCRSGKGPALVHGHVIRPYSHSLSDNEKLYRPETERQKDAQRDPITRMQLFLIRENILNEDEINKLEKSVDEEVQAAAEEEIHWGRFLFDLLETLVLAVVLFIGINAVSARVRVDGTSMVPTLQDGRECCRL